jgi:hypothetical protein
MWIITAHGFYSVVQKPEDVANGTVTIRARVRADLEALGAYLPTMGAIVDSVETDYRYRIVAPRADFSSAVAAMANEIGYDNFKSAVAARQGPERAEVYSSLWLDLLTLQQKADHYQPAIGIDAYPTHGSHSRS